MGEIYTRQIKTIISNGSNSIKIIPTAGVRLHSVQCELTYAGGTNTLAGLMTTLTEIRYKVGTVVKSRLNGTKLRDFMLLHGTTYDFNGLPNTGAQVSFVFAPEWFLESVSDALAWNPNVLGGAITIEIDCSALLTVTKAFERVSMDLGVASAGILTFDTVTAVAGGLDFYVQKEIDVRGQLYAMSIYPDSTNSNAITPASLLLGPNDFFGHERLSSAQNTEQLERYNFTPQASGRTASVYDIVPVKADKLDRAWNLPGWGEVKVRIEAAAAMAGTCAIMIVRLEPK